MTQKNSLRPAVEFATGQASVKGEKAPSTAELQDAILVRPRVSFPKSTSGGRLVSSTHKSISDSASSVHARADGLHTCHSLEEQGRNGSSLSFSPGQSRGSLQGTGTFGLFCVFDGHNGVHAAQHLEETLLSTLEEKLPAGHPPSEGDEPAYTQWREELQRALVETFCDLNEAFACKGQLAGATVTVVLQYGWLLTVANCGDSRALLDTCHEILHLSVDHRISTHQEDRRRLQALGAQIAPIDGSGSGPAINSTGYGPLRVWPGGLCLSRGIGDFDVGPAVIACPHIFQVRIPDRGGRLIVASDGVWDGFANMERFCRMSRNWPCQAAPNKVIQALQRAFGGLRDDTSIIVLDVLPPQIAFPDLAQQTPKRPQSSSGACFCFAPPQVALSLDAEETPPKAVIHSDIDTAAAIGLIPTAEAMRPAWCDEEFCQAVSYSQSAACNAWNEARSLRSMGQAPSRQDLASFFSAVHPIKPLDVSAVDTHDLDISTRPTLNRAPEDVTVRPRCATDSTLATIQSGVESLEGSQGDASTRFREHVADQVSFVRKFGHYKNLITKEGNSEEGSTTEDDSMRAGVNHEDTPQPEFRARESSWEKPSSSRYCSSGDNSPQRKTSYQLESTVQGSYNALPTVEEEKPIGRRKTLKELVAEGRVSGTDPHAAEMAVRRGKNRFMTAESVGHEHSTQTSSPMNGRSQRHRHTEGHML